MINFILISLTIVLSVYLFLKWSMKNHDYFEKQGLKNEKPFPLVGNSHYTFTGKFIEGMKKQYFNFPDEKVIGSFEFTKPAFFLRSTEVIKQITIKDFSYFQDHVSFVHEKSDDIFAHILFMMKGKQWRDMRSSLSPLFTGRKMRIMLELITKCCTQTCNYLKEDSEKNGLTQQRMKILFSKYTNDVVATCAFGVEVNSLKNPNNEMYKICQKTVGDDKPFFLQITKVLAARYFPRIANLFNLKFLPDDVRIKFTEMTTHTMEVRKRENIQRPDMLQLFMQLKEEQLSDDKIMDEIDPENKMINGEIKTQWTDLELIAQCFSFFLGGFHTTSSTLAFSSYALAVNPDIQDKLMQEVDETHNNLCGKPITYEILTKLKYMDMFISEVLRMWPPAVIANRECKHVYTYEDNDGFKFTVQQGDEIIIPIYAIHMDPRYFPNPEKFDPERFSDEGKINNNMDAYLPFGIGPRICIAFRFALMMMKAVLFELLVNFRMTVCENTQIPVVPTLALFGLIPKNDVELQLIRRTQKLVVK